MIQADLIVEGAAELLTLRGASSRPRRGEEMREMGIIRQGALAARRGKIVWVGSTSEFLNTVRPMAFSKLIDAYGKTVWLPNCSFVLLPVCLPVNTTFSSAFLVRPICCRPALV